MRKGVPNEHRALVWMAVSGAQDLLEKNPGYFHSLLGAQHDPKLVETICTGQAVRFDAGPARFLHLRRIKTRKVVAYKGHFYSDTVMMQLA